MNMDLATSFNCIRDLNIATLVAVLCAIGPAAALADMQPIDGFAIDRTEVTIGQYRAFVDDTGT